MGKIGLLSILLMVFIVAISISYANQEKSLGEENDYVPGELIVKYKDEPDFGENKLNSLSAVEPDSDVIADETLFNGENDGEFENIRKLKFSEDSDIEEIAQEYSQMPNVEYAEPNYIYQIFYQPNDPSFSSQLALTKMRANESWNITKGNSAVIIAIIDTGVDWNHPDLAANIWNNTDEIEGNDIDDDGNGYIDDVRGYDFVNFTDNSSCYSGEDCTDEDNNPMDFNSHGTHVSGIAAAVTNNSVGIAGVCWHCKIMQVRAGYEGSDGNGYLAIADISQALHYAADNNATIISMSFGGSDSSTIQDAIDYAYNKSILIASAGNSGTSSKTNSYPAAYDNVIAVAATDSNDSAASYSNYGTWVDVAAPGSSINSTYFDDAYETLSGTSMSAPHVAGAVGLLLSYNSSLNQTQIRDKLKSSNVQDAEINRAFIESKKIKEFRTKGKVA